MDQKKQFQFLLYRAEAEDVSVNALVKDETIWLTQKAMAELFGIDKSGISRHIKNIFDTGELEENVVVAKIATTTQHGAISGKTQMSETTFYNLDYDKWQSVSDNFKMILPCFDDAVPLHLPKLFRQGASFHIQIVSQLLAVKRDLERGLLFLQCNRIQISHHPSAD